MLSWLESIYRTIINFFEGLSQYIVHIWTEISKIVEKPHILLNWLWTWAVDFSYWICQEMINITASFIVSVVDVFPAFGLNEISTDSYLPSRWLSAMNWILPLDTFAQAVSLFVISTTVWATFGIFLRWLKINI